MSGDFDSFDVENSHTVADGVNNGVIINSFLPTDSTHAHTYDLFSVGVDYAGWSVGLDRPTML